MEAAALAAFSILALALLTRFGFQRAHEKRIQIASQSGIDERGFVEIGGIGQWITVRGENRTNPVLLILHGGPGAALSAVSFALFHGLEKHFTVVHWDQRGAGRTYGRNGRRGSGDLTIPRMTRDGIEVAEHLCARLGKPSIFLCAISWGSVLALGMVRERPDLFAAYVGTGQIVDMLGGERFAYRTLLSRARACGHKAAIAALELIGPPPFSGGKTRRIWQQWLLGFAPASERRAMREMPFLLLTAPRMSLRDVWDTISGIFFSYSRLFDSLMAFRAEPYGWSFRIPMYFFQGSDDLQTPTKLVRDFVRRIRAPRKVLIALEGGGHLVVRSMRQQFIRELIVRIRALPSP
jgi:pimeloyl-ACP methyl ester carboxylesterase